MAPFQGWGSTVSVLQRHYEKTNFYDYVPGVPGTHLRDFRRIKG